MSYDTEDATVADLEWRRDGHRESKRAASAQACHRDGDLIGFDRVDVGSGIAAAVVANRAAIGREVDDQRRARRQRATGDAVVEVEGEGGRPIALKASYPAVLLKDETHISGAAEEGAVISVGRMAVVAGSRVDNCRVKAREDYPRHEQE